MYKQKIVIDRMIIHLKSLNTHKPRTDTHTKLRTPQGEGVKEIRDYLVMGENFDQ